MPTDKTIEDLIIDRFIEKIESDESIPNDLVQKIRDLRAKDCLSEVDQIIDAIKEGVKKHAKD
ncbi:MAG: hypothetical protein IH975_03180 [Nitrospinae bacterium]|nr:hypothetical protein [Nitrospinota bacterium]